MKLAINSERLPPQGPLVIAVSGGCDSMAVWDVLADQRRWPLIVWHLNHGIRVDAARDGEAIARLAARHAECGHAPVAVICEHADVPALAATWGIGIEAAGRRHRYARLSEIAHSHAAATVVTAHHQDDQAETVLMNLLRGAGPDGWRGIAASRPLAEGVALVRPALGVPRSALRAYAVAHELPWCEDVTNTDIVYRRNLIRQHVLPDLERACPGFTAALLERAAVETLTQRLQLDAAHEVAKAAISPAGLYLAPWSAAAESVATTVLANWLRSLAVEVDRHRLGRLRDLCRGAPDRRLRLGPWTFTRYRDRVGVGQVG